MIAYHKCCLLLHRTQQCTSKLTDRWCPGFCLLVYQLIIHHPESSSSVLLKQNIQRTTSHEIPINALTSKFDPISKKNTSLFFHTQPILYLTFHHPIPFQRTVVFVNLRIAHRWSFLVYLVKPNLLETCTFCRPANLAEARLPWDDFWS